MEFNLTAKDKHVLKMLVVDLYNMLKTKKGEGPEYEPDIDTSFFKTLEGKSLDDIINWAEDFRKRMDDGESRQLQEELDLEKQELIEAGWIIEQK
jgi:hypothetical protein